ncbi:hypothetical protein QNH39_26860 [Neobacillus novalis]|uniref:RCK C-terminal domain-containing protein n=1 Tax=Neobacillus novalis TaxID=220687 RepID=A0AA95MLG3_9BACI|nr:hypothetical protein [Neobacillus novalis]WHY86149.1 hypothetical protein QNH39_26860 [Neobacillus novalis]
MNLLFLLIYFFIIITVTEIFVILFRLTGLKSEVSRFQVVSMMTSTGFTTGESELILGHPVRRKLGVFLILFGAFSLAVIISSISQFLSKGLRMKEIVSVASALILVFGVLKLTWTQTLLSAFFHRKMNRKVELADLPIRDVFLTDKADALLNLHIYKESTLNSNSVGHVHHGHEQLEFVALFIKRGEEKIRKNVYDTTLQEGDQLLLFGAKKVLSNTFADDIQLMKEKHKKLRRPGVDEMKQ